MMFFDPLWLMCAIPGLILGIYAQIKLSANYNKYMNVRIESGLSGAQAARQILDHAGLVDVTVEEVPGRLTDHYDPTKRALFLSSDNFHERSVSAVGVAAHETGHALQHQAAYAPLNLRMALVPVTQFASYAYMGVFLLGAVFHLLKVVLPLIIGIFAVITLFQLITLPVEFDASRRAKEQLFRLGLVRESERAGISQVLNAAAMTYVAALVSSVMELLYWVAVSRDRR